MEHCLNIEQSLLLNYVKIDFSLRDGNSNAFAFNFITFPSTLLRFRSIESNQICMLRERGSRNVLHLLKKDAFRSSRAEVYCCKAL